MDYLVFKEYLNFSMTHSKCQLKKKSFTWWWMRSKEETEKPQIEYIPSAGNHFFIYKGKKIWASTSEGETILTGYDKKPTKMEFLQLTCSGQDTSPIKEIIEEAIDHATEKDSNLVNIY